MARRGENIRKRKDGRWEGRYIKVRTPEGKIQWGYIYGSAYAEVKQLLIRKKAEAGFYNLNSTHLTFEELAEVWLQSVRNSVKESTYAHYQYHGLYGSAQCWCGLRGFLPGADGCDLFGGRIGR